MICQFRFLDQNWRTVVCKELVLMKIIFFFIRYIYCDEIDLENEYLLSVLYLAKKYDLPVLANKVACRILEILNEENFFDLIEPAAQFELKNVNDVIGKTIQFNTEWLIKCNKFTELHRSTLAMILDQPKLSVKESTLFEACVTWAKKECKRNDIEHPTSVQLRNALGNLIYKFRIASFSAKEFTDGPGKSKIYTDSEMLDCMFYISSKYVRSGIYQFSSLFEREIPQPIVIESPFSINIENGAYWDSSSYTSWTMKSDCVLKFNKTVSVVSFSFKSSYNNLQFTKLTITDQTNSNEFLMIENPCSKQENKCVVVFKMNVPVAFQAGKEYIISLFADSTNKFQYCSSFFSYPYYDMKPVHFSNGLKAEFLSERMPIQLCLLRLHISN